MRLEPEKYLLSRSFSCFRYLKGGRWQPFECWGHLCTASMRPCNWPLCHVAEMLWAEILTRPSGRKVFVKLVGSAESCPRASQSLSESLFLRSLRRASRLQGDIACENGLLHKHGRFLVPLQRWQGIASSVDQLGRYLMSSRWRGGREVESAGLEDGAEGRMEFFKFHQMKIKCLSFFNFFQILCKVM